MLPLRDNPNSYFVKLSNGKRVRYTVKEDGYDMILYGYPDAIGKMYIKSTIKEGVKEDYTAMIVKDLVDTIISLEEELSKVKKDQEEQVKTGWVT